MQSLLHTDIQNYIKELQELLTAPDEQALLDNAATRWELGQEDPRYRAVEWLVETQLFGETQPERFKQNAQPPSSEDDQSQQNKPIR